MCRSEEGEPWAGRDQTVVFLFSGPLKVLALHSLILYSDKKPPSRPPSVRLAQAVFEPNLFPYKYPNNLIPVILPAYTAYEYGTDRVFRNRVFRNRQSVPKQTECSETDRVFRNRVFRNRQSVPKQTVFRNRQSVPKRRHTKFRLQGITQKKEHSEHGESLKSRILKNLFVLIIRLIRGRVAGPGRTCGVSVRSEQKREGEVRSTSSPSS